MPLTTTPTDYCNLATGFLATAITTTTATGFVVTADQYVTPAGTGATTWPTGPQIWKISRKTRTNTVVEFVGVETASQSGVTVTTGTVNRYLPANGSSLTSQGNGVAFPAGSTVELVWHAYTAEQALYKDVVNTITGSGAIRSSSTTTPVIRLNSVTTTQRLAMSPSNGDMVYDSSLSQIYKYEGSAWAAVATGSFSNAANGTAGKVDLATEAEVAAGTAVDASSGAPNVIPISIVKTSSSGAVNGTVPALNSAVALDVSIGGTGRTSVTSGALLVGAGTSQMTIIGPGTSGQVLVSNGSAIAMGTAGMYWKPVYGPSSTDSSTASSGGTLDTFTYTIPANDLVAGVCYVIECGINVSAANGSVGILTKLGGTTVASPSGAGSSTTGTGVFRAVIRGTAVAGAAVVVECDSTFSYATVITSISDSGTVATNGNLAITLVPNASTSCTVKVTGGTIWRVSSTIS